MCSEVTMNANGKQELGSRDVLTTQVIGSLRACLRWCPPIRATGTQMEEPYEAQSRAGSIR